MSVLLYMVNFTSTLVAGGLHHQRPTYTKVLPPCWQKVCSDPWATWNQRGWPPSLNMARLHVNLTPPAHLQFLPHTHTREERKVPNATDLSLKCDMKYDDFTMDSCVSQGCVGEIWETRIEWWRASFSIKVPCCVHALIIDWQDGFPVPRKMALIGHRWAGRGLKQVDSTRKHSPETFHSLSE